MKRVSVRPGDLLVSNLTDEVQLWTKDSFSIPTNTIGDAVTSWIPQAKFCLPGTMILTTHVYIKNDENLYVGLCEGRMVEFGFKVLG